MPRCYWSLNQRLPDVLISNSGSDKLGEDQPYLMAGLDPTFLLLAVTMCLLILRDF
jgi:hypothetical protein